MELCRNCSSGCCRRYRINIYGSDIIRICENLNVDISFIVEAFNVSEEKAKEIENEEAVFIFTDAGKELYFRLFLKKSFDESLYFPKTRQCMFLQEWKAEDLGSRELSGIIGRCGIYDIRPLTCRAWPVGYCNNTEVVDIRDPHLLMEKETGRVNDSPAYDLCSQIFPQDVLEQEGQNMAKHSILNYHESNFFIKLAKKWNQNPDLFDNFYKFLKEEYNNRIE